ncbi:MAG: nucleoside deaminase [Candidatus Melainabacteria bacterium]|nr:nucleoside deaminase [Candidatus Melainabacteria bacterium]
MKQVINLAKEVSLDSKDIPVAALIVDENNKIIGKGINTREKESSVIGHAEINAIQEANKALESWNLSKCRIYVNLEPCAMCAGAILQSHISEVIFAAYDIKSGALGSRYNIITKNLIVKGGIMEIEAQEILGNFFKKLRE